MHLLSQEVPAARRLALCCAVISTLTALVAGNESARCALQNEVGAAMLAKAVLEQAGPQGPPRPLMRAVLAMVLEVSAGCAGCAALRLPARRPTSWCVASTWPAVWLSPCACMPDLD